MIPGVLGQKEVERVLAELSQADVLRGRAGVRHAMKLPAVAAVARKSGLLEIAQRVLGKEAIPFRATLFDKSPTANWLGVWHQDTALPLSDRRRMPGWGPWALKGGVNYAQVPTARVSRS